MGSTESKQALLFQKRSKNFCLFGIGLLGLVVLLHAGLIGRARWQGDEYFYISALRSAGWRLPLDRIEHWSPRLWSEMMLALYGLLVIHLHRPLAGSVEAVLWAMFAAAALLPAWRGEGRTLRLLIGLALLTLCLLGHPIAELFFWPAGSLAYIPTLAGLLWLFWSLHDGPDRHPKAASCALLLAAGSSETGLFLALALAACALPLAARRGLRPLLWILPGLVLALAETLILTHGRVGQLETVSPGSLALHHALASLHAGSAAFAHDMLGPGAPRLTTWLLVLLGMRWCGLSQKHSTSGPWLACLAAALLLACWITIVAAFYQFGELCCQRHATMRDCFILLAMASLGAWSAQRWPRAAPGFWAPGFWAPAPLLLACLGLFALRAPALLAAWRLYPATLQARTLTWQSGLQPDTTQMTLHLGPDDTLIGNGAFLTPGSYPQPGDVPWYVTGVLRFFQKGGMEVEK